MTHEHYVSKVFSDPSKNTTHGRIKWEDTGDISTGLGFKSHPRHIKKGMNSYSKRNKENEHRSNKENKKHNIPKI